MVLCPRRTRHRPDVTGRWIDKVGCRQNIPDAWNFPKEIVSFWSWSFCPTPVSLYKCRALQTDREKLPFTALNSWSDIIQHRQLPWDWWLGPNTHKRKEKTKFRINLKGWWGGTAKEGSQRHNDLDLKTKTKLHVELSWIAQASEWLWASGRVDLGKAVIALVSEVERYWEITLAR